MVNVFGQIPNGVNPDLGSTMDDVKNAIAMMMQQQQAGEAQPRQPTPQEEAQLKQTAMAAMQAKGAMPGQAPQQEQPYGPPLPPGMGPMGAPAPSGPPKAPAPSPSGPSRPSWMPGPSGQAGIPAGMPGSLSVQENPTQQPPATPSGPTDEGSARESIVKSLGGNLLGAVDPGSSLQERFPKEVKMIREGTPDQVRDAVGTIQRRLTGQEHDKSSFMPNILQDFGRGVGHLIKGRDVNANDLEGTGDVNKAIQFLQSQPQKPAATQPGDQGVSEEQTHEGSGEEDAPFQSSAPSEEQVTQQQIAAQGSPEHIDHIATTVAPEARKTADAMVKAGADSPDKADMMIRQQYKDDPELEKAIQEARDTFNRLHELNNQPPSVVQYIGAILVGLAGGGPQVMNAILNPHAHLNMQREQMAGEGLLRLQLARAQGRMHQNELAAKTGADSLAQKKLDTQMAIANQREEGMNQRAESAHRLQSIKDTIDYYKSKANEATNNASKSVGATKKKLMQDAQNYENQAKPFMQMLNDEIQKNAKQLQQPQAQQHGGPTSMASPMGGVSPSAARLLGMGA